MTKLSAASRNPPPRLATSVLRLIPVFAILALTACQGTKAAHFETSATPQAASDPDIVLVSVSAGQNLGLDAAGQQRVQAVAALLQAQLIQKLQQPTATIAAAPAGASFPSGEPRTLLLRCTIVRLDPGNRTLRLTIGFGAGRARLGVHTALLDLASSTQPPVASWDTNSTTGAMPSPAFGIVSAPNAALAVASGSAGMFMGLHQTEARQVDQTSAQIVAMVQPVFQAHGWNRLAPADASLLGAAPQ